MRVGYLVGAAGRIARSAARDQTYISPSMVAQAIVFEFCVSGALDGRSRPSSARCRASRRALRCARARASRCLVVPEGGYFLWVDLPEGTDVAGSRRRRRSSASRSSRAATSFSRAARLDPPRILGRYPRADRRGRRPARRRLPRAGRRARVNQLQLRQARDVGSALPRLPEGVRPPTPGCSSCCRPPS